MKTALRICHRLYEGYLNDWPGRDERWVEDLRYLGSNRWTWRLTSLNPPEPPMHEGLSTRRLISRVMEEDANIGEPWVAYDREDSDITASLGPQGSVLLAIAEEDGAEYCAKCLKGWLNGNRPPRRKLPHVRVLKIIGPVKRPVWLGVIHHGLSVETNHGTAFLYPEHQNGWGRVVLPPIVGPNALTRPVKLSRKLIATLNKMSGGDRG